MSTEKGRIHGAPNLAVNVLRGALPFRNKPADLFRPHILKYPCDTLRTSCGLDSYRLAPRIEHLDICATWKGLDYKQASELLFWERALVSNVESIIQRANDRVRIRVDLLSLITRMFHYHRLFGSRFLWFTSTGDVHKMITKFIRTYECFFGSESTMTTGCGDVWLDLYSEIQQALDEQSDPQFGPRGCLPLGIIWRPSFITFQKFNNVVCEGQEFILIPRLWRSEAYGTAHTNVSYETSASWLRWDDTIDGFRGRVTNEAAIGPAYYYSTASTPRSPGMATMRIIVSAIGTESFASDVRLEKKFRTRVSLKLLPPLITSKARIPGHPSVARDLPDTRSDEPPFPHKLPEAEWVHQKLSPSVNSGRMEDTAESCRIGYITPPQEEPHSCEPPIDVSIATGTTDAIRQTLEELPPFPGIDLELLALARKQLLRKKRLAEKSLSLSEDSFDFCPSPNPSSVPSGVDDNEAVDIVERCDEGSRTELNCDKMRNSLRIAFEKYSNERDTKPGGENEQGSPASLDMENAQRGPCVLLHDWSFAEDSCEAEFEEKQESRRVLLHDWSIDSDCFDSESESEGEDDPEGTFERGCIEFDDQNEHETPPVVRNCFDESCDDVPAVETGERPTPEDAQEASLEKRKDKGRRFSELLRAIQARGFWGSWEGDARMRDGSESEYSLWAGSLDLA